MRFIKQIVGYSNHILVDPKHGDLAYCLNIDNDFISTAVSQKVYLNKAFQINSVLTLSPVADYMKVSTDVTLRPINLTKENFVNFVKEYAKDTHFDFASMMSHPESYYDTNTRGTILPKTVVCVAKVLADDFELTPTLTKTINDLAVIEQHAMQMTVSMMTSKHSNTNALNSPKNVYDYANALRMNYPAVFGQREMYSYLSIPQFLQRYYEQYNLLKNPVVPVNVACITLTDRGSIMVNGEETLPVYFFN